MSLIKVCRVIATLIIVLSVQLASAADRGQFSTAPVLKDNQRWRVGYYEGGAYIDYQKILIETVRGLMKLGWVEETSIPAQAGEQTDEFWRWLSTEVRSDYIEFVPDAHYSAGWDDSLREVKLVTVLTRLNKQQDIDLMIAMGTWAGKDMANARHSVPTMVLSASDPLAAGIINSVEDSGFDHLHATVDPNRFERQIRIFHDVVGFQRLGVAYENSVNGRSYAAIDVLERVAKSKRFEIVRCHTLSDISDSGDAEKSVIDCFKRLAPKVDAIYVTQQGGITENSIPALVKIANQNRIPTFSQSGSEEVKQGFLLSLSQAGFRYVGEFHASTFAKVFNGAKPRQLDQLFEEPPKLALNLKTAELVEFDPPLLLLGATDEIYRDIKGEQ